MKRIVGILGLAVVAVIVIALSKGAGREAGIAAYTATAAQPPKVDAKPWEKSSWVDLSPKPGDEKR